MKLNELTSEQLLQLKQSYLTDHNESVSYGELADADELVSMEELEDRYGMVDFTEEDFC